MVTGTERTLKNVLINTERTWTVRHKTYNILQHHKQKQVCLCVCVRASKNHTNFPLEVHFASCGSVFYSCVWRSRGERFLDSPVLFWTRALRAESCACRYLSIMLLCLRLSFSLHQTRSQYCSTCGRFEGPISCKTSLNHVLAGPRLVEAVLAGHGDHTLYLLSRDRRSERVSACKTSNQKRERVCVNPCSRDRHTYLPLS